MKTSREPKRSKASESWRLRKSDINDEGRHPDQADTDSSSWNGVLDIHGGEIQRPQYSNANDTPKPKPKLQIPLYRKRITKYKPEKRSRTRLRRNQRILPDRKFTPKEYPLVPFWALGYVLSQAVLGVREAKRNFNINDIKQAMAHLILFTLRRLPNVPIFLVCGVAFGGCVLLKGLWLTIQTIFFFIYLIIVGFPEFIRDCRYFVRRCSFPTWNGTPIKTQGQSNSAELKQPLGVIGRGFLLIGGLSFIIKIIQLPLNEILVSLRVSELILWQTGNE